MSTTKYIQIAIKFYVNYKIYPIEEKKFNLFQRFPFDDLSFNLI